jgi:hypothetical protein
MPTHTGGRAKPRSDAERQILDQVETLPSGQAKTVGGVVVQAEPPYFSASGSVCRWLVLTPKSGGGDRRRLACKDGTAWFYAPSVLASPGNEP